MSDSGVIAPIPSQLSPFFEVRQFLNIASNKEAILMYTQQAKGTAIQASYLLAVFR